MKRENTKKEKILLAVFVVCVMLIGVILILVPFVPIKTACLFAIPAGVLTFIGGIAFVWFGLSVVSSPDCDYPYWNSQ